MNYDFTQNAALHLQQLDLTDECLGQIEQETERVSEAPRQRSEFYRSERKFLVECPDETYTISFQIDINGAGDEEMEIISVDEGDTL